MSDPQANQENNENAINVAINGATPEDRQAAARALGFLSPEEEPKMQGVVILRLMETDTEGQYQIGVEGQAGIVAMWTFSDLDTVEATLLGAAKAIISPFRSDVNE